MKTDHPQSTDQWTPTREVLRRLLSLLDHPEPGLFTWHEAVCRVRGEALKELQRE